jgi:hypothetical protein
VTIQSTKNISNTNFFSQQKCHMPINLSCKARLFSILHLVRILYYFLDMKQAFISSVQRSMCKTAYRTKKEDKNDISKTLTGEKHEHLSAVCDSH